MSSIEERRSLLVRKDSEEQVHKQKLDEIATFAEAGYAGLLQFSITSVTRKSSELQRSEDLNVKEVTFVVSPNGTASQNTGKVIIGEETQIALKQTKGTIVTFNLRVVDESITDDSGRIIPCEFAVAEIPPDMGYHCILEAKMETDNKDEESLLFNVSLATAYEPLLELKRHHKKSIEEIKKEMLSLNNNSSSSNSTGVEEGNEDEADEWEDADEEEEDVVVEEEVVAEKEKKSKKTDEKKKETSVAKPSVVGSIKGWMSSVVDVFRIKNLGRAVAHVGGMFGLHNRAYFFFGLAAVGVYKYGDYASL